MFRPLALLDSHPDLDLRHNRAVMAAVPAPSTADETFTRHVEMLTAWVRSRLSGS
ncbi:hypothetical protein PSU4_02090 [Pseudonocardia sulfidoxydans NBRC 16205]|uniref:Uncharacterized protein n=1 Tax=Pseudonocardia sulfidoxydans NBRC 16205 TaxID=1223511 RepID=A0A511D8X8_9PSEU|nr:hypothetical protein [Pseudonocardia sulfidoxydans]GEL21255.1 hypothetical protein PSU4_02090 [Pseudonocardia sulfidoxydans NBRC 16205]